MTARWGREKWYNKLDKKLDKILPSFAEALCSLGRRPMHLDTATPFGQWIKQRRKELDLTQAALSEEVGCAVDTLRRIESGRLRPSRQLAELLAAALEVPSEEQDDFVQWARRPIHQESPRRAASKAVAGSFVHPPTNLPSPLTPFIGRERELERARSLLWRADVRLVTLTGPPGIGKTRLSMEVAASLLDDFGDGVFFVPLAPITDPLLVAPAIARVLGVREVANKPIVESLKEHLHNRRLLLVLDNFEQVMGAALLIVEVLTVCPQVKALVTSREALRVRGEKAMPVPAMQLPEESETYSVGELEHVEAVTLFLQRAEDVNLEFALSPANAPAVSAICRRLEGLPLALELAASHMGVLTPQGLLDRLQDRLGLLTRGARDLPAHHETLEKAINWSHDLLSKEEQVLFRRLAVFVKGCDLPAVESVCNKQGDLTMGTLQGLISLRDKSLLYAQRDSEHEELRFAMLETIREYAITQLERSGEADKIRRQHAEYYLDLAEMAEPHTRSLEREYWLYKLEQEYDNLRLALNWALKNGESKLAVELAGALGFFWYERRYFREGSDLAEQALALGASHQTEISRSAWAQALQVAGILAYYVGDHSRSVELLEKSIPLYQELNHQQGLARSLNTLGNVARDQGNYHRATVCLEESLRLYRELKGKERGVATVLNNLGLVASEAGDLPKAAQFFDESLALRRNLKDKSDIAFSLMCLGEVALYQGELDRASQLLDESLALHQELHDKRCIAMSLCDLGMLALARGDIGEATALHKQSLQMRWELGENRLLIWDLEGLAAVSQASGQTTRAVRLLAASDGLRAAIGIPLAPSDHTYFARTLTSARSALDDGVFQAAWNEGTAMGLEDAVSYALDQCSQA